MMIPHADCLCPSGDHPLGICARFGCQRPYGCGPGIAVPGWSDIELATHEAVREELSTAGLILLNGEG